MRIETKSPEGKARTGQEASRNPARGNPVRALRRAAAACALLILALALGAMQACSRTDQVKPAADQAQPSPSEHAAKTVTPGSYEDWCDEHAVPESQCTRCNPTLVAAFKATGDWCAEHDLPESQCLLCNPDLKIVRPPRPEGS